jgi:hypothetical protein
MLCCTTPVAGSQYTGDQFQRLLADHGVVCSMSRSGNAWANSAMKSFLSSLKTERTARKLCTRDEVKADVFRLHRATHSSNDGWRFRDRVWLWALVGKIWALYSRAYHKSNGRNRNNDCADWCRKDSTNHTPRRPGFHLPCRRALSQNRPLPAPPALNRCDDLKSLHRSLQDVHPKTFFGCS